MVNEHPAPDTVSQRHRIEIDDQTDLALTQAKISQQSCLMRRTQVFHGFKFQNDLTSHNNIGAISGLDLNTAVSYR
jgi:hypothetical protein